MSYTPIPTRDEDSVHTTGDAGMHVLGIRQESDASPVSADGDYHPFVFNQFGRMKVSTQPAAINATTGNITAIQATIGTPVAGGTVIADVARASNVTMYCTGTFSAVNCTFEATVEATGENWFAIQGVRTNSNTIEATTSSISAAPAYAWEFSVNAYSRVRVRATARTSGTQAWVILPGVYATEPAPAVQTHPVTGSGNFAVTMAAGATASPAKARDAASAATDVGSASLYIRRDTPTTLTPVAGDYEVPQIDSMGATWVREKTSTVSAVTSVASSASNVTILALNAQRRGATICNDSTAILYLKLGATASTSSFTVKMLADAYYEVPAQYTGIIDGIWASANGNARVTEITS